jgi:DNA-binding SARP family transcriptional activator
LTSGVVNVLQFRLLGPIAAFSGDQPITLGGSKPRALLAVLLLESGRVVSAGRLVDVVWPNDPPESARALVQTYVSTLRKSFARHGFPDVIRTHPPGYVIHLGAATVDADVFAGTVADARRCVTQGDDKRATELLREAIALWRGPALSGLDGSVLGAEARRLDELLMSATEERFAAELRLGRYDHLADLAALVARHPTNERIRGQLMVTLYALGRHADALTCYHDGRTALAEELGVEPCAELTALYVAVLRGDTDVLRTGPRGQAEPLSSRLTPGQLPPAPGDFTGHAKETAALAAALGQGSPAVRVIAGPGGVGKSTLAVHVAHRMAASFPDGQLYAELHGMTVRHADPADVLGAFLRALGTDAARVPETTQERAELYRSLLAERRVLVLLDDAASEQQVRPLLPGGPGCGVLITSRDRLAGLSGAGLVELSVLALDEARELLCCIVGEERIHDDADSADEILTACGGLPLAIRIAGTRLAIRRQLPLKVLAGRLADERRRLTELAVGDLAVRASIGLSYRALDAQAQVALRRMGYLGLPSYSTATVGCLLGIPASEAERRLEALVDAQLVTFTGVDRAGSLRYRLHDLVRLYAYERASEDEPPVALRDSVIRAVSGWLITVDQIAAVSPSVEIAWRQLRPGVPQSAADTSTAVLTHSAGWLRDEEASMVAGVERAADLGLHQLVRDFVSARLAVELEGANRFDFRGRIIDIALETCRRARDIGGEASLLTELAQLRYAQDLFSDARRHFTEALSRFRTLHDERGQAAALAGLGLACREPGWLAEARHFLDRAATLLAALDDDVGTAYVHRIRGSVLLEMGDYPGTLANLEVSLKTYERAGNRRGVAYALRTLGLYHRARGEYLEALRACADSAAIFEELGDELMLSYAVRAHAKTQIRMGCSAEAVPRLEWALSAARTFSDRWGQAMALRILGQLHLAEGRLPLAQSCLTAAVSIWDTVEAPLWRARAEHDFAILHRAMGDLEAAQRAEAHAREVFRDHGAREYYELPLP